MRIEAEANLSALIESTEDLIWSVDPRYRLITFNHAFSQYFEQSFGGPVVPGISLREQLPPAYAAMWPPLFDRALQGEKFRTVFSLVDGRILELVFKPIIVDGITTGVSVFGKDITEREKSENAIKKAEANLSALIESTEDLIWSVDLDYRLITFNRALQQNILNTYGVHIAVGMCFHEVLRPDKAALWPVFYEHVLSQGTFRVEYTRMDGGAMELAFNPIVVDGETTGISIFGKEITEQKTTEESRRFLAEVVESCEEAIITNAPSGEILTWNHGAETIYGYSAAEMIGKPFSMVIAPELRALADRQLGELLGGAPLLETQGVAIRREGSRVHVAVTTWPIRNSAGEVTAICTIVRDVSARHEAEKSRALLASVVESSSDAIHAVNLDGTVVSWNRGAEALFGYTKEEIIGRSIAILAPPGRVQEVASFMGIVAQGEYITPFDTFLCHKDGRGIDVSLSISPIRNSDGQVVGAAAVARDISQRKQSEQALQEAEKKYRDIFKGALEGICQATLEGRFLAANPALARMLGYDSPEELISMVTDLAWDVWVNPETRAQYLRQLEEHGSVRRFECQFKRKDGRHIWVSLNDRGVYGADGSLLYLEGFMEDITERKRAEAELRESLDTLKDAQVIGGLGSYVLDIGTGVWISSDVLDEIFGISKEYEHTVKGWTNLIHPDDRVTMAAYFSEEVVGKGRKFNREYRIIRQTDQAERWVHGLGRLEFGGKGQPVKMRGVIKDITESKLSEMQLRDSEERYRATFEQAAVGIVHASLEGRYLRCNARFAEIIGYPQEEVPSLSFQQVTAPEDLKSSLGLHRQLQEDVAESPSMEKRYVRKDGSLVWVKVTLSSQCDGEGRVLYFIAIVEEIQARKEAEERLAAAANALRSSEERYRTAFQMNHDAIDICRLEDGRFIEVNEAFVRCTGFPREEVIGHTAQEIGIWVNAIDRQILLDELCRNQGNCNYEARYQTKNGDLRWSMLSVAAIELDGVPCILSITHDITDAKASEERLAVAANALRSSEERYRTAFQANFDAMIINRVDNGRFIDCNQAFLDTSGYTREEVLGRSTLELGVWADARDRTAVKEMLHRDSGFRGLEVQFRKKNGEVIWGDMSATLMDVDGVPCILSVTRDISAAKTAEKTIRSLAFYDPLTGLPNRRHLMERLRQPLDAGARSGRSQALLLVDLDHFKTLNDTLGHQTGDLLLQEVARRILACVHEADTVCRLGGDEFVVVLEDQSKVAEEAAAHAKAVGEKILAAIDQPCMIDDHECLFSASIGIAVFGDRQDSTDEILQQAEIALYQAKAAGRNTMRFFSPALQAAINVRATLEEDLRQGIKARQFLLYYQPQVERGRLTGAEALIRWKHPRRGLVQPNDFIPLAEESRLILPLGGWVLETACAQIALWAGRKETAHLSVAVNISALQFRQPAFVEQVLATLSRSGANPGSLRLELTESMLVENLEDIIAKMTELKSHGLRFSLDDFGTGYSSLTYLKRLPLDRLKIDRSFVRDMMVDATSGAIAQTILSLGRAMGISVIAEGVETEEQRGYLAGLGCHSFQGFLFSRPLPLGKFEAFLKSFAESGGPG
ncbi:MAG: PAS domain S-box protein [Terracidiphilus sp.]|jgi:diguanylate cyclase (GGDEF)-like protein/PAS domain S-box-containing protein